MAKRNIVRWDGYHVPVSSFSMAVRVPPGAELVFISGITARQKDGTLLADADIDGQARLIFDNIKGILSEVGGTLDDIVKTTAYVRDAEQIERYRDVRNEYFGYEPPASTIVEVSRLYDPRMLVEVEAIAAIVPNPAER
jgi:2-iminobutanoate/2-iminopropanoate deaminase